MLVLIIALVLVGGSVFGVLQLDRTKSYIADRIERQFETRYPGQLEIGRLDGLLPFRFSFEDVALSGLPKADSAEADTVIKVKQLVVGLNLWNLLQNTVTVNNFLINDPHVRLLDNGEGGYTIGELFTPVDTLQRPAERAPFFRRFEILAPTVSINRGSVYFETLDVGGEQLQFPQPFSVDSINTQLFLELSTQQRFLDIENFSAEFDRLQARRISLAGQIYNDNRFLEFNAFNLETGQSTLSLNGEIDGVDLYRGGLVEQLREAQYNLEIGSDRFYITEFRDLFATLPDLSEAFQFGLDMEGNLDTLWVDRLSVGMNESALRMHGALRQLSEQDSMSYQFKVDNVIVRQSDLEIFTGPLSDLQNRAVNSFQMDGSIMGTPDTLDTDLEMRSNIGNLKVIAGMQLHAPFKYSGSLSGKEIDLAPFFTAALDTTNLNFESSVNGVGFDYRSATLEFTSSIYNSWVNGTGVQDLDLEVSLIEGFLEHEYRYTEDEERIVGNGWIDLSNSRPQFSMEGRTENLNFARLLASDKLVPTSLNIDYNVEFSGFELDSLEGRANLDIKQSVVGADTVRPHQFYVDLDSPELENRTLRLTSSLLDMTLVGSLQPSNMIRQYRYWNKYLSSHFRREILLQSDTTRVDSTAARFEPMVLKGNMVAKDIGLIRSYISGFPAMTTDINFDFDLNADSLRFLLRADMMGDTLRYNEISVAKPEAQVTASFRSNRKLKEFSSIDFRTSLASLEAGFLDLDSLQINLSMKEDQLIYTHRIGRFAEDAGMNLRLTSTLSDTLLDISVDDFYLGNDQYAWRSETVPKLTYNRNEQLSFREFTFQNQDEFLGIRGTLSPDRSDSLVVELREVQLDRISDLINGRLSFSGRLNGTLTTRSLTREPTVQGDLNAYRLYIEDRLIGDVQFNSRFNPRLDRFDTSISIVTDTTKYASYLDENDDIGQRIYLDGYFLTPDRDVQQDTVFYFDANFKQIDMWVIPLIAHNAFENMEGRADGEGYLTGNLNRFEFHSDFQAHNVFAKPKFLNTNYFLNGHVIFNSEEGVVLDSVDVADTKGGTGKVWGSIDLNNFRPINDFDLTMSLNRLQFLNNQFDPDVPFYGSLSGTGSIRLTGTNTDMLLRTPETIRVTSDSKLSIPLLEQTELTENTRFIRFVDSFDTRMQRRPVAAAGQDTVSRSVINQFLENLTFTERTNLDLQFDAPNPMTVELIFDPVTGEVVTAEGTGRLRLTMQEEDVQMFGRYEITGGTYLFVGGDIFTRRLQLEPGGTIVWEGDPDNARLDISAVYQARPNVATLIGASGQSQGSDQVQRVPVELVVRITGTLASVENSYFFRLPNTLDISSNTTLTTAINEINRNDEAKLLQATSLLFTGDFINVGSDASQGSLTQSFTRGSNVINPLLSSQVISPLLSNQINALLNSDVSRLDVDFQLTTYNEIDLGVALRLYNDKLILRREGRITGGSPESSIGERIGDLNATYRINKGLSITAFHRQDQTLSDVTTNPQAGDLGATIDGIGLEANVQFNTWQDLTRRINNTLKSIFGSKKDDEEKKDDEKLAEEAKKEEGSKKEEN